MILEQGDIKVKIELVPVTKLMPHEETVGHLSKDLIEKMKRDGVQLDPVIADEKSGVVLDGMHRLQALKGLRARVAVCYLVDYNSEGVSLSRWLRAVRSPSPELTARLIRELELRPDASASLESPKLGFLNGDEKLATSEPMEFSEVCSAVRLFDRILAEEGARVEFLDEEIVRSKGREIEASVLLTPKLLKSQVIFAGRSGALLPPKSSLHVFPFRPVDVRYPLESLISGPDDLEERLAGRTFARVEPPAFHEGRVYREELLRFQ